MIVCCLGCCCFVFIVFIIIAINAFCASERQRAELNKMSGVVSPDLTRVSMKPRPDKRAKLEKYKIFYGDDPSLNWDWCEYDTYWNELGKADISADAEVELMEATFEIHSMVLEAVDTIVHDDNLLSLFYINRDLWPAIRHSWYSGKTDF